MTDKMYFFIHGHERLIKEEADIVCAVRFAPNLKWCSDNLIKELIRIQIKRMYGDRFPNAKRFQLSVLFKKSTKK